MFCHKSGGFATCFNFLRFGSLTSVSRIIALEGQGQGPTDLNAFVSSFQKAWTSIINDEPLTCLKTSTQYEPTWSQPCAAIIDVCKRNPSHENVFTLSMVVLCHRSVRTRPRTQPSWHQTHQLVRISMLSFFAMFERDLLATAEAEATRTGKRFDVVASGVSWITTWRASYLSDLDDIVAADAVQG